MAAAEWRILDELLVIRAQSGDPGAVTEIVRRYHAPLTYYVRRWLGPRDASADDLVQQTWVAAIKGLPRLRHTDGLRVWLYRIARNIAVTHVRRREPRELDVESRVPRIDEIAGPPDAPGAAFTAEDAARVHAALAGLSEPHREVLVLRFVEDMSYDEIAAVVGRDVGTVKSRLHYAKRMLRRALEPSEEAHHERR